MKNMSGRGGLRGIVSSLGEDDVVLFYEENGKYIKKSAHQKIASEGCFSLCREAKKAGLRVAKEKFGEVCGGCGYRERCPGFPQGTL